MTLPNPKRCPKCQSRGTVIRSCSGPGYVRRRHRCVACGKRWTTWQSLINPRKVEFLFRRPAGATLTMGTALEIAKTRAYQSNAKLIEIKIQRAKIS